MTAERWSGCQKITAERKAAGILTTEVEAVAGRRPRASVAIDALNLPETIINIRDLTIRLHGLFGIFGDGSAFPPRRDRRQS